MKGIEKQVRGQVYIASLLLDFDNLDDIRPGRRERDTRAKFRWLHQSGKLFGQQKCAHMDRDFRHSPQRVQIKLLSPRSGRINPAGHARRIVFDAKNLVSRVQKPLGKGFDVEPFQRGPLFQQSEIQIEPVNINRSSNQNCTKNSRGAVKRPAPKLESNGIVRW